MQEFTIRLIEIWSILTGLFLFLALLCIINLRCGMIIAQLLFALKTKMLLLPRLSSFLTC
uniref:Uncharacterized protein n=1 Tax=Chenopodium quinoa TaxID=63459 RepID=A0A803NBH8_CHEQI